MMALPSSWVFSFIIVSVFFWHSPFSGCVLELHLCKEFELLWHLTLSQLIDWQVVFFCLELTWILVPAIQILYWELLSIYHCFSLLSLCGFVNHKANKQTMKNLQTCRLECHPYISRNNLQSFRSFGFSRTMETLGRFYWFQSKTQIYSY